MSNTSTNEQAVAAKKPFPKKIIIPTVAASLTITLGIAAGLFAAKMFKGAAGINYGDVDVGKLTDDLEVSKAKLDKARASGTPLEIALKPSEMVNLAFANYKELPSAKAIGLGAAVSMGVKQEIQSIQIKDGSRYFEESNSLGLVNLYDRMYQEGDTTTCYWGESLNYSQNTAKEYTNEEYAEFMGRKVSDPLIYVVSAKTAITKEEKVRSDRGPSKITKQDYGYLVDLELNPKTSVVNYVKQMQNISGLTGYPTFYHCHLTFRFDENLMPIEYTSYEKYNATKASVPLPVDIEAYLTTRFFTTGTYEIPKLTDSTQVEYANIQ